MAESITAAAKLKGVLREFRDVATATASQIVEEMFLPLGERTIRPVDVGGVAGGTKFIHNGCFFKFVETSAIYASYAQVGQALPHFSPAARSSYLPRVCCVCLRAWLGCQAMKAANHEYRSNNALRELAIPSLECAFQLLIDVHGFRCSATPVLPISAATLVYGSDDAARTVRVPCSACGLLGDCAAADAQLAGAGERQGRWLQCVDG